MTLDELKGKVSALEDKVTKWFKGAKGTQTTEDDNKGAEGGAQPPTIEGLSSTVATLEGQFTQLNADLATAKQTIGTLTAEKTTLEGKVTTLTNEKAQLTTDLGTANGKVTTLETTIADPKGEIAKQVRTICAGQGIDVDKLPAGKENDGGGNDAKSKAEKHYMKLIEAGSSLEAGKYWQENRELLK